MVPLRLSKFLTAFSRSAFAWSAFEVFVADVTLLPEAPLATALPDAVAMSDEAEAASAACTSTGLLLSRVELMSSQSSGDILWPVLTAAASMARSTRNTRRADIAFEYID